MSTHWLTRYDPDDGEPYGEVCACEIGDDHDGAGDLNGPDDEAAQNDRILTDQERESLTTWGETFSAQIRPGGMALHMRPEAPRSTEDGQPYLMEWHDVERLRELLIEAHTAEAAS